MKKILTLFERVFDNHHIAQCILRQGERLFRAGEFVCAAQERCKDAHSRCPPYRETRLTCAYNYTVRDG